MSRRIYTLPIEQTSWQTPTSGTVTFDWMYDERRDRLLSLYEKGKRLQWNASTRIDWSYDVDPDNPLQFPEYLHPLYPTPLWGKLDERQKTDIRRHMVAWQFSQFLHGEQGALICAAKIVETVPSIDAKFYAATQVMDEARHVEVYSRYLYEKIQLAYPINPSLKTLLDQVLGDPRWDFTYLGMQILIEGLALAAFGTIRDNTTDPLGGAINAYVMQDEARHVAFGRFALRDYYPELSDGERAEREEFCVEACYLMRDRLLAAEMWHHLGFGQEAIDAVEHSEVLRQFRAMLFARIVPALREIGLWGVKVQSAFEDMGVMGYANTDLDQMAERDEAKALEIDRQRTAADAGIADAVAAAETAGDDAGERTGGGG